MKNTLVARRVIGVLATTLGLILVWYPLSFWWELHSAVAEAEEGGRHVFIYPVGDGSLASMLHAQLVGVLLVGLTLVGVGIRLFRRPVTKP